MVEAFLEKIREMPGPISLPAGYGRLGLGVTSLNLFEQADDDAGGISEIDNLKCNKQYLFILPVKPLRQGIGSLIGSVIYPPYV